MPLYLVRWPDLTASLVRAADEDELAMMLDEVADPGCASIQEYEGPLWVDFSVPVTVAPRVTPARGKPIQESDLRIEGLGELAAHVEETGHVVREDAASSEGDARHAMLDEIGRVAFPLLATVVEKSVGNDENVDAASLERVVRGELQQLLEHSWRLASDEKSVGLEELRQVALPLDNRHADVGQPNDAEDD
jgi:hypothetical protein